MFKKIYDRFIKYIKDNRWFILILITIVIVLNIKVDYVISSPGGILPLNEKITINNKNLKNNYYSTYVKVYDGTVATYLLGKLMPKWEVNKLSDYTDDVVDNYKDVNKIDKILMKQGNNVAIAVAFDKAKINYEKINLKLYVLYKLEDVETDFEIGDQIYVCDSYSVNTYDDLRKCIDSSKDDELFIGIIRNNKKINLKVKLRDYNDQKIIGINVIQDFDIDSDYVVRINDAKNESGSSGGFITALSIYDELSNLNLSKNLKIAGTGTIDLEGNVGEIGGIKFKLLGANKKQVDIFFCPDENYKEALKYKKKYNLKIKIVKVKTIDDAINYLLDLKKNK